MKLTFNLLTLIGMAITLQGCNPMGASFESFPSGNQVLTNRMLDLSSATVIQDIDDSQPSVKGYVRLQEIQFGYSEEILIGVLGLSPENPDVSECNAYHAPFLYRLNVHSMVVEEIAGGKILYRLSAQDISTLKAVLSNSVIGTLGEVKGLDISCDTILPTQPYANLLTDKSSYILTSDETCGYDLWKSGSWKSAGLKAYLSSLESKLSNPDVDPTLALGVYPMSSIKSLVFGHSGGMPGPAPSRSTSVLVTFENSGAKVSVTTTSANVCAPNEPCPLSATIISDCSRPLDAQELVTLRSNLASAYLGVDESPGQVADAGDFSLSLSDGRKAYTFNFVGGDNSHSGTVIFGQALLHQLLELRNEPSLTSCAITQVTPPSPVEN